MIDPRLLLILRNFGCLIPSTDRGEYFLTDIAEIMNSLVKGLTNEGTRAMCNGLKRYPA